jgi:hypothetical protein
MLSAFIMTIQNFIYPEGSGGSWLANLIGQLETSTFDPPNNKLTFDQSSRKTMMNYHEILQDGQLVFRDADVVNSPYLIFSTPCRFNILLNLVYKKWFNPEFHNMQEKCTINQQFMNITNHATYLLTDSQYQQLFFKQIDLEYSLIFQDPVLFAEKLYDFLDLAQLSYTKNTDQVLLNIKNYLRTCENPADHVDNYESIVWLGWCHALSIQHQIPINAQVTQLATVDELSRALIPNRSQYLALSKDYYFI